MKRERQRNETRPIVAHYLDLFDSDDEAAIARLIAAVEAALSR